jgi:hypothetical protein
VAGPGVETGADGGKQRLGLHDLAQPNGRQQRPGRVVADDEHLITDLLDQLQAGLEHRRRQLGVAPHDPGGLEAAVGRLAGRRLPRPYCEVV